MSDWHTWPKLLEELQQVVTEAKGKMNSRSNSLHDQSRLISPLFESILKINPSLAVSDGEKQGIANKIEDLRDYFNRVCQC